MSDEFHMEISIPTDDEQSFNADCFERQKFEANTLGIRLLRRGVIGVSEVGYI